ncbi:MAG: glycosyltransferase family 4 protein, partial [Actinobacteria bacterium]|nr:glycosyltransferase family 4 protein [Actinomycetota bacterium]
RRQARHFSTSLRILSVFRLDDAERKGVRTLLSAIEEILGEDPRLELTLAGRGPAPQWLREEVAARSWARLVESPRRDRLADLYQTCGLFVLPTRTDVLDGTGEGFGIVLIEAQLAGLPVVGPAFGGSADAMVTGVTGMRPTAESANALADVLRWCLHHPDELEVMAANAATWAQESFSPDRCRDQVMSALFDEFRLKPLPLRISLLAARDGSNTSNAP